MKKRVLLLVGEYPQISETYIACEIEELSRDYELGIVATKPANRPYAWSRPHAVLPRENAIPQLMKIIQVFRPHLIHAHYMHVGQMALTVAERTGLPFTIRTHSFDVLVPTVEMLAARTAPLSPLCLGVLHFPFVKDKLLAAGYPEEKLISCWPVIDYQRFIDRRPNGDAIMNCGAAIPKKAMQEFVALGRAMPDRSLNLYALGYDVDKLEAYNQRVGSPIRIRKPVEPREMPREYKKHAWLVYTAARADALPESSQATVGWPLAAAEAMASGVGVCMARVRKDMDDYVGDAGILYDDIREVPEIIAHRPDDAMRERGFEWAKKCDIREHIHLLTDLWQQV